MARQQIPENTLRIFSIRLPDEMIQRAEEIRRTHLRVAAMTPGADLDVIPPTQEVFREAIKIGLAVLESKLTQAAKKAGAVMPVTVTTAPVALSGERAPRAKKPSDDMRAQKRAAERAAAGCECKPGRHASTCRLAPKKLEATSPEAA